MISPTISIIIPSYNKVKYIKKTLESIFNQNYKNFEVIIQDGGSDDGTLNIIRKYAKKYPALIKYMSQKDNGQLDAINLGIKKAKGDIVTFINADDVYTQNAFEAVAERYQQNPEAQWYTGKGIVIDENDDEIAKLATWYKNLFMGLNSYLGLLITNYLMQPSVFITTKAIKKYGTFTGTEFSVMEYDLWLKIGEDQMPVIINKVLSKFRIEKDTKTSINSQKLLSEDEKILKKYTSNLFIIFLHRLNNFGRKIILKVV